MEEKKTVEIINLKEILNKLFHAKRLFLKVWVVTFILSCIWILPQPRTYDTSVKLAPESSEQLQSGTLGSLASSFGINMGNLSNTDAIYPLLYPDVVGSTDFIVGLLKVPVKNKEGDIQTDYLTYLVNHQKQSLWSYPRQWLKRGINALFPPEDNVPLSGEKVIDPFCLSNKEYRLVERIRGLIRCSVDKKTEVITITVSDQDPLICATMADSVRVHLQEAIIKYRTSKARTDVEYYTKMQDEAYQDYQNAVREYSRFCDTHHDVLLQSVMSQRDNLENDMQLKYNTYNVMFAQLNAAKAKVQERTPAFTILQNATVPVKPSAPKRMVFVVAMLLLATIATSFWLVRKDLHITF